MATTKKSDDLKTVTGTSPNGSKVTVSEELARKMGRWFTKDTARKPSSRRRKGADDE